MKCYIVALVVFAVSYCAQASYLNWQVNNDDGGSVGIDQITWAEWNQANLVKTDGNGLHQVVESQAKGTDGDHVFTYYVDTQSDGVVDGYSYYIELVNSASPSQVVGYGETKTYSQLSGSITTDLVEIPTVATWHGGTFRSAPEPTSAMLMLLGVAGLALRRKQRKIA